MKVFTITLLVISLLADFDVLAADDVFDDADANGDEVLPLRELTAVRPLVTPAIFDIVDGNDDGLLDYEEFRVGSLQGYFQKRRFAGTVIPTTAETSPAVGD